MAFCKLYNMKDLTEGKPIKVIWLYALPMILGQIAQQFYSFCDSAIVGNCINPDALAAVGATSVISNTLIGFLNSATLGLSIPIARYFGAQDQKNMRKCIGVSAILTFVTSIVLTIVGLLFIYDLLVLLGTPEEILGIAVMLNIGLDLLFIQGFHSGVAGAAIATVISQAAAGVACFIYIFTKCDFLIPKKDEYRVDHTDFSDLVQSALAMGFMSCIVNIGTVTLQSSINKLGTNIITAHTAARKIFDILDVALYIIGNAVTTFVSQNIGAKRIDRVKSGIRAGILINTIATTLIILVGFPTAPLLLRLVAGTSDAAVIDPAVMYIRISMCCFYVLGPLFVLRCAMQGMGRKIVPVLSSTIEMVGKILAVMFLAPALGYLGVAITEPIIWAVCTLMLTIMYVAKPVDKMFA